MDPFIKPIRGLYANYITTLERFKKEHSLLLVNYDIILKDDSKDFVIYAEFGEGEDGELVKENFQTWVAENRLEINSCIRIALDTKKTSFCEWFWDSEKFKEPDELVLYCLGKMTNKHVTVFNDSYVWTTLSKHMQYDYLEMMEKSAVNLIFLGERDYAILKKKGTAVCDPSPEPKTKLTVKVCATGKSRKPKNLDISGNKKVTCRTTVKRKSTSPRDQNKKKPHTLAEARQERISTSSSTTDNTLLVRGKRSSHQRINYLELNDGLDENPEPICPKRKRQQQHTPSRTGPSVSCVAAYQRSTSPPRKIVSATATLKGVQTSVSSNETAVNTVNNTALNGVHQSVLGIQSTVPDIHPSILGVQTTNEDTLPDLGTSTEPDIEALLLPTTTMETNPKLQKEAQSTEDKLDAVDALLGLQHPCDNSIVGQMGDDNSQLMPIGGGENVPEDIAPQPLLLDQVNVDNAIATMIATEQEAETNTNRNKEQAENTLATSKGENPVEPATSLNSCNVALDGVHTADVGKRSGTAVEKNLTDGVQTNVTEGTTTEKDSDGDKIRPSHGAFKMQLHGLKRKAAEDRSYQCQLCGAHELSQQSLNNHHHLRHKPQMCGTCGKIFELAMSLTHHMYSHYKSKYYCDKCNFDCYFKSELKNHKIMHHTTPQHQCMFPNCSRWFMRKGDLVIHVETHRKRKLKCDDCDFETNLKKYLKEHQRVHEDDLPYKCEKCGKGFKWRSSARNHRKNAHK